MIKIKHNWMGILTISTCTGYCSSKFNMSMKPVKVRCYQESWSNLKKFQVDRYLILPMFHWTQGFVSWRHWSDWIFFQHSRCVLMLLLQGHLLTHCMVAWKEFWSGLAQLVVLETDGYRWNCKRIPLSYETSASYFTWWCCGAIGIWWRNWSNHSFHRRSRKQAQKPPSIHQWLFFFLPDHSNIIYERHMNTCVNLDWIPVATSTFNHPQSLTSILKNWFALRCWDINICK